jgi:hypothetical protein
VAHYRSLGNPRAHSFGNAVDQVGSFLADQCDAGGVAKAFSKRDRNLGVSG